MIDEITVSKLQKDPNMMGNSRGDNSNIITLAQMMRIWERMIQSALEGMNNGLFIPQDKASRLKQLEEKIKISTQAVNSNTFMQGLDLQLRQMPITLDPKWGNDDGRQINLVARIRISYNPLDSPVIARLLGRKRMKTDNLKFTDKEVEKYDGDKRLEKFKNDQNDCYCSSDREIEDANCEWQNDIWYNPRKIHRYCIEHAKDGFSNGTHFGVSSDMVSNNSYNKSNKNVQYTLRFGAIQQDVFETRVLLPVVDY